MPSRVDLRNVQDAREWANTAMVKRPWRAEFFARITEEVSHLHSAPFSILELGSGPGFLAQQLLSALPGVTYAALDFSPAMHDIARQRLGKLAEHVRFIEADFSVDGWATGLSKVDAVVTSQAVHELRHKLHASAFYQAVRAVLKPSGVLLVCDHFAGEGGMADTALFMTPEEQESAIVAGGFLRPDLLMCNGGLVLFRARPTSDEGPHT